MQVLWDMKFTYYAFMTTRTQAQVYSVTSVTSQTLLDAATIRFVPLRFAKLGFLHSIQGFKHHSGWVSVAQ